MRLCIAGMTLLLLGQSAPPRSPGPGDADRKAGSILYFFFTPDAAGAIDAARHAVEFVRSSRGRVRLRPVLLVSQFRGLGMLQESSPFYRSLKELQALEALNVPLYDEEGLELAERWELRSTPSFVVVTAGRAHRVAGSRAKLEDLLECRS